jgi:hypothetical protein
VPSKHEVLSLNPKPQYCQKKKKKRKEKEKRMSGQSLKGFSEEERLRTLSFPPGSA